MKTFLAFTIAGAALIAAASSASAQDCVGGYRMIKDQVPVACGGGPETFQQSATRPEEPLTTGSIRTSAAANGGGNSTEIPSQQKGGIVFADSRDSCKAGQYYMQDMQSMNIPERCP